MVMSVSENAAYCNEDLGVAEGESDMLDVIRAIQEDRRHEADRQRIVSSLPTERTLSMGRYRLTFVKRAR